ncbi:MAG TPA: hypothetical protein VFL83_20655 [Anaeromyxobacter sp.]|nr:hypothetical protein [Anaeromyxobacter sp.]
MRLSPTTRVIAVSVLLLAATAVIWWGVGFPLGSALLDGASAWRSTFGYGPVGLMRLFALALAVPVTIAVVASASPQARWMAIAALAAGAVFLYGDRSRGDIVGVVLLVLAAAVMAETSGTQQLVSAAAVALVIAFASLSDLALPTPQLVLAMIVRAAFFYVPLLVGPALLERYALRRLAK